MDSLGATPVTDWAFAVTFAALFAASTASWICREVGLESQLKANTMQARHLAS